MKVTPPDGRLLAAAALCLAGLALLAPGCGSPAGSSTAEDGSLRGELVLTGSSTVAPLVVEIARRFEDEHPQVRIEVQAGGSSRGIADARRGTASIGMVSRALAESEQGLQVHTIARDGVALILHAQNPQRALTRREVVDLFTGRIRSWDELGGPAWPVTVVSKSEGRATLAVFLEHFGLKSSQIQADVVVGHNEQAVKTVAGQRGAVGYVSIGTAAADIAHGVPIRLLPLEGVAPRPENVATGAFPLSRPLNLVTRESPRGLSRAFIDYARSEAVHDLVEDQHFTPALR